MMQVTDEDAVSSIGRSVAGTEFQAGDLATTVVN